MTAREITAELQRVDASQSRLVIVTGGEPALQWDELLASEVAAAGFRCHMESNGTRSLKGKVDWLTVSPKPQFHEGRFNLDENTVSRADECKIVVDDSVDVEVLDRMSETFGSAQLLVQPCHDERYAEHLARTLALLQQRPHWRLSLQLHKIIGVP